MEIREDFAPRRVFRMRLLRAALISIFSWSIFGQTYTISTFAGGALPVNVPGPSASLSNVSGVAVDTVGNVFFVSGQAVFRLDAQIGVLTLVAGNGIGGFSGDIGDNGPAVNAELSVLPDSQIAADSAGNLYIADSGHGRIRKVSNGVITTVAGGGVGGTLLGPLGVAVDSAGNLYIADTYRSSIRKVSNGVMTTVAGNGTSGFSGDGGPATNAQLYQPTGVAVDSAGNVYIADTGNNRIREVSNGVITTLVDSNAAGIVVDSSGNLYLADTQGSRIREVSAGAITTIAGSGTFGFSGDGGSATNAQLSVPTGVAVDSAGNVYIADSGNFRIRRISNAVITTIAGDGTYAFSGDGSPATSAQLYGGFGDGGGLASDSAGNIYCIAGSRIRKISNGVITTVAGNGTYGGFSGDGGPATSASFSAFGIAADAYSNLYIADASNERVRRISNGVITTVAGNGTLGFSGDGGPAAGAQLGNPSGVAVDPAGNIYIADVSNLRVRVLTPTSSSAPAP
jgi:sugar lactone lactonase YvrE